MSDFSDNNLRRSMARAQRAYDNQMPPEDDDPTRECDQCGDEYNYEVDFEGDVVHSICEKCRQNNEEGPQT